MMFGEWNQKPETLQPMRFNINDQWIEDKTDLTSEEIMDAIRRLCEFAGLKVDWDSYDKMNNQIIAKLDQTNNKA